MDKTTQAQLNNLWTDDRDRQNQAYYYILEETDKPVDWAYEVWDELLANLTHKDNYNRAIAAQILSNLAKSDPENRILKDFDKLLTVTKDERFVTARHCMQSLWKVGVAGNEQQKIYLEGLERRFKECLTEKNGTLIRYDIIQSLRNVYDAIKDENVKERALDLIQMEEDPKYRRKYTSLWKK
jgi:hypothetical protein